MPHKIPWHHRPVWRALGWPLGGSIAAFTWLVRLTSHAQLTGPGAHYPHPAVYVSWHRHVPYSIILHGKAHRWQLMSNAPYMEPIAVWCHLMGLRSARSAPTQRMRESLTQLVDALSRGESAVVFVDGPAGPARQTKPGCIELARLAGVPIIPVAYCTRSNVELFWRWDKSVFPIPFDQVRVYMGEPLNVALGSVEEALRTVDADLRSAEASAKAL